MAPTPQSSGFVYRRGSFTARTFTPRSGNDTTGRPGVSPGISTSGTLEAGIKGQRIDLSLLRPPLMAFADDPAEGGEAGHVVIAPVDDSGAIDQPPLEEWAAYRDRDDQHPLTTSLLEAVVQQNLKGPL